ncbi:MAG TPA: DUF1109 domain-containing protein [Rhizomicrobium sp.]|nr:DUF1109 domain-containing protein [Rhizomicrobium sp.]
MKTDALIDTLSERAAPVSAGRAARVLALCAGGGALVSIAAMLLWLGIRPDITDAMATSAYWMKFFYTLLFTVFGFWTIERLARPGTSSRRQMILEALPFAGVALLALVRLALVPAQMRMPMMMGHSSHVCPWRIAILALPVFAGTFWSLRKLAPTRPAISGLAAGLAAGALGAFIYAFHCDESAAAFVALWYTLGIGLVGLVGALLGRLLLRW